LRVARSNAGKRHKQAAPWPVTLLALSREERNGRRSALPNGPLWVLRNGLWLGVLLALPQSRRAWWKFSLSFGGIGFTISRFGLLPRSRSQDETWAGGRLLGRFAYG